MKLRIVGLTMTICALLTGAALAGPPSNSLRPDPRPKSVAVTATSGSVAAANIPRRSLVPLPRPVVARQPSRVVLAAAGAAVRVSVRPGARPENLRRRSVVRPMVPSQPVAAVATTRAGSICGDRSIRGQKLAPIPGRLKGCGIAAPVRVTAVDGVTLSQPATLNCQAAKALNKWVKGSVKPAVGRLGGGVASLTVLSHYSCRTRNNKPGAKISEHARGNAIDIAAINLANGVSLTVLKGWRDRVQSRILKAVHKQACGIFGTVLGPNADRFHQDHLHLDVARYRGGAFCK